MKEIVYSSNNNISIIVADQTYKEVRYVIVNNGTHPCAYVECDADWLLKHKNTEWETIDEIQIHGGVTFIGEIKNLKACTHIEGTWFGWDYAHAFDWCGYWSDTENIGKRKYTTAMIVEDCESEIEQYLESKAKDNYNSQK